MIKTLKYKGAFITDTSVPGERKCDGLIPIHPAIIQLSSKRWIVFFSTLDTNGWDAVKSILYQLRADSADGPILKEGVAASSAEDWDPLERGDRFSKRCGTPVAFGVPKGARYGGKEAANSNLFVLRWYRYAQLRLNGSLLNPLVGQGPIKWPEGKTLFIKTMRFEWMQFRLKDDESDIEILQPVTTLRQRGYRSDQCFCSLGENYAMWPALTPPIPLDRESLEWIEFDGFGSLAPDGIFARQVAPVRYRFNPEKGLYEWVETGKGFSLPGRAIGESSILRYKGDYIIALREFSSRQATGATIWFRTSDPFVHPKNVSFSPADQGPREGPRTVYLCGDEVIRMFGNDCEMKSFFRNPLYCWDIDPTTFGFTGRRLVFDAQSAALPLREPIADMPKLCPLQADRQLLVFRAISTRHTLNERKYQTLKNEDEVAGLHFAEIKYK